MSDRVIDASVVAKWFLPEQWSTEAGALRQPGEYLLAPDVLAIEVSRIILRKTRRGDLSNDDARESWQLFRAQNIALHPSIDLLASAFELGLMYQRDSFDAVYITLALQERCTFVTADRVLYDALVGAFPDTMVWVGDLPQLLGMQPEV